jgi:tripartite-type tricarboxylate transporter receptor subunit TctC
MSKFIVTLLAVIASLVFGGPGFAQTYPSRPITIVVPYPPVTNADVIARFVADRLSRKVGKPVVVEAKPGGATVPGTIAVLSQPADGHTLLESGTATNINPLMGVKTPYDAEKDLSPIALLVTFPGVLVVHPSIEAKTVAELVALAKSASKPLLYSSPGIGSFPHLAMEQFVQKAGIKIDHVPFRGFGPSLMGVIRNDVQVSVADIPGALSNLGSGTLKALAQTGRERMPQLPDIPTMAEAGVPGYEAAGFLGISVRVGTPPEIVALLNSEVNAALASDEVKKYAETNGLKIEGGATDQFTSYLKRDKAIWAPVIEKSGIKLE